MTFEEFWKENYGSEFGTSEPYYGIASYAYEKGQENCNCVYTDNSLVIQKLEKENAELKKDRDYFSGALDKQVEATLELQKKYQELEAQIEKMKCCGNCEHFNFSEPNYCHKGVYRERQYVCSEWKFGN